MFSSRRVSRAIAWKSLLILKEVSLWASGTKMSAQQLRGKTTCWFLKHGVIPANWRSVPDGLRAGYIK